MNRETIERYVMNAVTWLAAMLFRGLAATLRWHFIGPDGDGSNFFRNLEGPRILAFWHEKQLLMPFFPRRTGAQKHSIVTLISRHRDGRLIADVVSRLGIDSVAGSSTRGGMEATRVLLRELSAGRHIAITPDGPKGPRRMCKPGVMTLAKLSGVPITPIRMDFSKKWVFSSWDRMELPKPFASVFVDCGSPIQVSGDTSEDELVAHCRELERVLNEVAGKERVLGAV